MKLKFRTFTQSGFLEHHRFKKCAYRICEPPRPILEHQFFDNLIYIFEQLIELGFTYYNGKVAIIEVEGENTNE